MLFLEIISLILLIVCAILGAAVLCLLIGARLGFYGLMIGISRDPGHDHNENGDCIPSEPKARKTETPVQWKPDGSHERID